MQLLYNERECRKIYIAIRSHKRPDDQTDERAPILDSNSRMGI